MPFLLLGLVALLLFLVAASGVEYAEIWAAVGIALAVTSTSAFWWLRCRPAVRR